MRVTLSSFAFWHILQPEAAPEKAWAVLGSSVVTTAACALLLSLYLPKSLHLEAAVQDHPRHAPCANNIRERSSWSSVPVQMMKSGGTCPSWWCLAFKAPLTAA